MVEKQRLVSYNKRMEKTLGKEIVIIVNTEDVKDWHRGMIDDIHVGASENIEHHKVVCKSKYRLKNGYTRIKFTTIGK